MGAVQESQTTSNTWLIAGAGSTIRSDHILPSRGVRPWKQLNQELQHDHNQLFS